jgi:hypothetical protein
MLGVSIIKKKRYRQKQMMLLNLASQGGNELSKRVIMIQVQFVKYLNAPQVRFS